VFGGINFGDMLGEGLTISPGEPGYVTPGVACEEKAYATLSVGTMVFGSNSYTTAAGTVNIYESGVDPTSPNSNPKDTITVSSGVGNTTDMLIKSCIMYSVVFDGSTTYYDVYWNDNASEQQFPYVQTDQPTTTASFDFSEIITVATIDDPIDESAVTGVVNGQTSCVNASTASNEINVGTAASCANGGVLYYDESVGDEQFYIDLAIGFSGGNKAVKDPVLCFVNHLTTPFEGDEFTSVTAQLRTGTDFGIPSSLTNYVNGMDCVSLGSFVEGGTSDTYRITMGVDETNLDNAADIMYIYVDDLGSHLGQDILRGTKATASAVVTLQSQA
ncbi:MAG: hypothetical protein KAJ93_08530, partial [Methanosarcinales archaeon]|nr:hypothetical protein [Methanosarcinales archaeon]